jgi:hypothetical protein
LPDEVRVDDADRHDRDQADEHRASHAEKSLPQGSLG